MVHGKLKKPQALRLYKQEGEMALYQVMHPASATGNKMLKYLPVSYGDIWCYLFRNYVVVFLQQDKMENIAKAFLKKFKNQSPKKWQKEMNFISDRVFKLSQKIYKTNLIKLTNKELWKLYLEMLDVHQAMWRIYIFIDSFDAGLDQEEINRIANDYNFDDEEIQILLTPEKPSYIAELEQGLYKVKEKKLSPNALLERFFWIRANYTSFSETGEKEILEKARNINKNSTKSFIIQQKSILKKHNLKNNPLELFQILTQWRDERKRFNYIGIYGLVRVLREGSRRQQIPVRLVNCLFSDEVKQVFFNKLSKSVLLARERSPVLINFKPDGSYAYLQGNSAKKEFDYLQKFIPAVNVKEIKGMIACKGMVTGYVRIVKNSNSPSAKLMQKGEILVTSMTRPEFVPLMKKAGAIITDEGGISSHAAIISRELGTPCIIGTKVATKVLKDGDLVEVDANKGVVKILNSKIE